MRILVVDDEPKELALIVRKLRIGWGDEEAEGTLEIVEAGSVEEVRKLIEKHKNDREFYLDHVFSDSLHLPGDWSYGFQDVYNLVKGRGLYGINPEMTVVSFDPNTVPKLAEELGAGYIFKSNAFDNPSLLIQRLLPTQGRHPEKL